MQQTQASAFFLHLVPLEVHYLKKIIIIFPFTILAQTNPGSDQIAILDTEMLQLELEGSLHSQNSLFFSLLLFFFCHSLHPFSLLSHFLQRLWVHFQNKRSKERDCNSECCVKIHTLTRLYFMKYCKYDKFLTFLF